MHHSAIDVIDDLHSEDRQVGVEAEQSELIVQSRYGLHPQYNQPQEAREIIAFKSYIEHHSILFVAGTASEERVSVESNRRDLTIFYKLHYTIVFNKN